MEYTKGWRLEVHDEDNATIYLGDGIGEVTIFGDNVEANARLISSAPDLYEALRHAVIALVRKLDDIGDLTQQEELLLIEARQALAKAEGE